MHRRVAGRPALHRDQAQVVFLVLDNSRPELFEAAARASFALFERGTEALAGAIRQYLGDAELRLRHGASGHQRARDYTLDRQVSRFEELYRQLAAAGIGAGTR